MLTNLSQANAECSDVVTFDGYVVGQTWGDVVIPEPTTMVLLGMGGLAVLRRRR